MVQHHRRKKKKKIIKNKKKKKREKRRKTTPQGVLLTVRLSNKSKHTAIKQSTLEPWPNLRGRRKRRFSQGKTGKILRISYNRGVHFCSIEPPFWPERQSESPSFQPEKDTLLGSPIWRFGGKPHCSRQLAETPQGCTPENSVEPCPSKRQNDSNHQKGRETDARPWAFGRPHCMCVASGPIGWSKGEAKLIVSN